MKTKHFLRRISGILVLLTAGILVFVSSCKKDENNEPPAANVELIGSATIGADGGTINEGDVVVEIPESSFSGSQEIIIYKSDEETSFGSESVSGQYYIKGLPDSYSKPLRISIKYSGTIQNESYMAFGEYYYCHSPMDTIVLNKMLPAVDSSGYLIAYLAPVSGKKANTPRYQGVWGFPISGISNYYTYSTAHFEIRFPFQYSGVLGVEELMDGLEGAFDSLTNWGFRNPRTKYPINVTILNLPASINGQGGRAAPYGVDDGIIQINSGIMTNHEKCRITGAHDYFHLVMGYYSESHNYNWVQEACAVWIETYFANNSATYISTARKGREGAPFNGLQAGIINEAADEHGYGLSSVMKYVAMNWGIDAIRMTWEEYYLGQTACNGLRQQTAMYTEWWGDYLKEYFLGNIYSDMGPQWVGSNITKTLRNAEDTAFSFKKTFPDLSGYIYRVEFEYTGFTDHSALQLSVTGTGSGMYIFKHVGSNMTLLGDSRTTFTVNDLKGLQSSKGKIYVLVYNDSSTPPNYLGSSDITLTGRVSNAVPLTFTKAFIQVNCKSTWTWVCPGSTYDQDEGFALSSHLLTGSFNGNTFNGSYSDSYYTESVILTVDPVQQKIASLKLNYHLTQPSGDYQSKTADCENIPFYTTGGTGTTYYYATGMQTCNSIKELTGSGTYQGCTRTLKNYWCTSEGSETYIEVRLE